MCTAAEREHTADCEPVKGSWEWACWYKVGCPCCVKRRQPSDSVAAWSDVGSASQTRWHVLTQCSLSEETDGEMAKLRERAVAWIELNEARMGCQDARWALKALRGEVLERNYERMLALNFMLGFPLAPRDPDERKSESLWRAYDCGRRGAAARPDAEGGGAAR